MSTCKVCKFAVAVEKSENTFQCRARPPSMLVVGMNQGLRGPVPAIQGLVPNVEGDFWCGEFQPGATKPLLNLN